MQLRNRGKTFSRQNGYTRFSHSTDDILSDTRYLLRTTIPKLVQKVLFSMPKAHKITLLWTLLRICDLKRQLMTDRLCLNKTMHYQPKVPRCFVWLLHSCNKPHHTAQSLIFWVNANTYFYTVSIKKLNSVIQNSLTLSVREPHLCLCKQVGSRPAAEAAE